MIELGGEGHPPALASALSAVPNEHPQQWPSPGLRPGGKLGSPPPTGALDAGCHCSRRGKHTCFEQLTACPRVASPLGPRPMVLKGRPPLNAWPGKPAALSGALQSSGPFPQRVCACVLPLCVLRRPGCTPSPFLGPLFQTHHKISDTYNNTTKGALLQLRKGRG